MSILTSIFGFVSGIISPVAEMVDNLNTSDEEKLQLKNKLVELQNNLQMKVIEYETKLMESQAKIITSETTGKALQRNWRPILMYLCMFIIFNNFVLVPYLEAFNIIVPTLEITSAMWGFLTVGVGGYIGARTYEKKKLNS